MRYTFYKELPTMPGWYRVKNGFLIDEVVNIYESVTGLRVTSSCCGCHFTGTLLKDLEQKDFLWAGPILFQD